MPKKPKQAEEVKTPRMAVYAITRRRNGKDIFTYCGSGYCNSDGSLNLVLKRSPYSGELHVRAHKDEEACWKALPRGRYQVFEMPGEKDGDDLKWKEVGVAFGNEKDQSLNVILHLIPENCRLNVRLPKEAE